MDQTTSLNQIIDGAIKGALLDNKVQGNRINIDYLKENIETAIQKMYENGAPAIEKKDVSEEDRASIQEIIERWHILIGENVSIKRVAHFFLHIAYLKKEVGITVGCREYIRATNLCSKMKVGKSQKCGEADGIMANCR